SRLENLVVRDVDPGVRSRAATVLGECGSAPVLPALWRRVVAGEDPRVQEKAWAAMLEILARSGRVELGQEWGRILVEAKQPARRLHLLGELSSRWQKKEETKAAAGAVMEMLIEAEIEQGKWAVAYPQIRELLAQPAGDPELERHLRWLLAVS